MAKKSKDGKDEKPVAQSDLDPRKGMDARNQRVLSREVYYAGQTIVRQGDEGYRAYYIERGRVEILVREGPHALKVSEMKAGDIFGEMALITREARSASAIALEETVVTIISRDEIEGKIEGIKDPAIRALINTLVERLRRSTQGQMSHYISLTEFQDRVTGIVDKVHDGVDANSRNAFRAEVTPLLDDLQRVLDRYKR